MSLYEYHYLAVDVPLWLKSLRLHKYQYLFADMDYEEMLQVTEDYLSEKVSVCVLLVCVVDSNRKQIYTVFEIHLVDKLVTLFLCCRFSEQIYLVFPLSSIFYRAVWLYEIKEIRIVYSVTKTPV